MNEPLIISIILSSNRKRDTLDCLDSLAAQDCKHHKIIVLDNRSTDGSVEAIHGAHPEVQIIELTENRGYSGNNNFGIEVAMKQGAAWIFLINEDTIFAPDCFSRLIAEGEKDPAIGMLGPMVYHHDEPTVIQSAGGMLGRYWTSIHLGQNEPDCGQYITPHRVEWISGCAILIRRSLIEQIGMLDEQYFIYWDEAEWGLRAGRAGWQVLHVPQAKIWHKGVQREYRPKPSVTYYSTRNHLYTLSKHKAPLIAWVNAWAQILRTLVSWSVKPRWKNKREHRNAMWRGVIDFLQRRWGQMPLK